MIQHPRLCKKHVKISAIFLFCVAVCGASEMNAQTQRASAGADKMIKKLQTSPATRHSINNSDKSLIETALASAEFTEKLAAHQGTVYVMMHGLEFENLQGITAGDRPVELLDKAALLEKNPRMFFILKDIQRTSDVAYVDMVMHYDFDGSYEKSIESEMLMAKNAGQWQKQTLLTKTPR